MASKHDVLEDSDVEDRKASASGRPKQESDDELLHDGSEDALFQSSTRSRATYDDAMIGTAPSYQVRNQTHSPYPGPPQANSAYPPGSYMPPPGSYMPPPGSYMPPPGSYMPPHGSYMPPPGHTGFQASNTSTTVIIQQPGQTQFLPPRNWSSNLCECGRDWSICCFGLFCMCCLEFEVAQDMGESCMLPCCVPGWLITLRTKMRLQENISGSVMDDCCHVCCCGACTICQLAYEIKMVRQRGMAQGTATRPI